MNEHDNIAFVVATLANGRLYVGAIDSNDPITIKATIHSCHRVGAAYVVLMRERILWSHTPTGFNLSPRELALRAGLHIKDTDNAQADHPR